MQGSRGCVGVDPHEDRFCDTDDLSRHCFCTAGARWERFERAAQILAVNMDIKGSQGWLKTVSGCGR